jgi:hypothetical protein
VEQNTPSTTEKPVKPPKPGILVEDRNAAVRTSPSGEQRIVKVPSREQEAERQGVSESQV